MTAHSTNFALLCEMLNATPQQVASAVGTDPTLVSRWRTGNRKLMPGRHWAHKVSEFFWTLDKQRPESLLMQLLTTYYPNQSLSNEKECTLVLAQWLTNPGQYLPDYQQRRYLMLNSLAPEVFHSDSIKDSTSSVEQSLSGLIGLQGTCMTFLDAVLAVNEPEEILVACVHSVSELWQDPAFAERLMNKLDDVFAKGHRLKIVIRKDCFYGRQVQLPGRIMKLHMKGYIQSRFDPNLKGNMGELMLAAFSKRVALRELGAVTAPNTNYTTLITDAAGVKKMHDRIRAMFDGAETRFTYDVFHKERTDLAGIQVKPDDECYLFMQLPHFCVASADEYAQMYSLNDDDIFRLKQQFTPMVAGIKQMTGPVHYVFCQDDVDEMLLKSRHSARTLSEISDHQVYMSTADMVKQLQLLRATINERHNVEVAFLPRYLMKKIIQMEIGIWGTQCMLGVDSVTQESIASRSRGALSPLKEYCEQVWSQIPFEMRSRSGSKRMLDIFLEKAKRYGY